MSIGPKRLFENKSLIKKQEISGCCLFSKRWRLLKLFRKSFTKNLYNFSMLSILTFQTRLFDKKKFSDIAWL